MTQNISKQHIEDAILGKKKTVVKGEEKEDNCLMQLQMHSRLKTLACSNPKEKILPGGIIQYCFMPHLNKENCASPHTANTHELIRRKGQHFLDYYC